MWFQPIFQLMLFKKGKTMDYHFSNRVSGLKPSAIREILKHTANPEVIPFAAGNPAADAFPKDIIKKNIRKHS